MAFVMFVWFAWFDGTSCQGRRTLGYLPGLHYRVWEYELIHLYD